MNVLRVCKLDVKAVTASTVWLRRVPLFPMVKTLCQWDTVVGLEGTHFVSFAEGTCVRVISWQAGPA